MAASKLPLRKTSNSAYWTAMFPFPLPALRRNVTDCLESIKWDQVLVFMRPWSVRDRFVQEIAQLLPAITNLCQTNWDFPCSLHYILLPYEPTAVLVAQWLGRQHCAEDSELSTGERRSQIFSCKTFSIPNTFAVSIITTYIHWIRSMLFIC